ncbi:MAG: aspartate kinase [Methylococcales bacterium]|jgi:aspartate kinase|nr:aspartate kinase [Methylococcales bacterium]
MALIVQKYGGTSVGTVERIQHVAAKVAKEVAAGNQIVVTVSAMSGQTNKLIELATEIDEDLLPREYDVLVSTGEQVTIALLSMALNKIGCKAKSYTGSQIAIKTDSFFTKARIKSIDADRVQADLDDGNVIVVAGFQGVDDNGNITTLGRGGSDTTAVAMAAVLKAQECQIFTDVDGVYTTDPRIEPRARRLEQLTFEEMLEMASLGSKVLQIRAVEFAGKYSVPLRVLSSFEDGPGTLITYEDNIMERPKIAGIALNKDEAKLTILGVPDKPGVAHHILGPISEANMEVDMIVQNTGEDGTTDFTFTIHKNDYNKALDILLKTSERLGARKVSGDDRIVKLSLVGVGMRSHAGIANKMFASLAEEKINIRMISTSEIKISVVINERYAELAVRTLHEAFELENSTVA